MVSRMSAKPGVVGPRRAAEHAGHTRSRWQGTDAESPDLSAAPCCRKRRICRARQRSSRCCPSSRARYNRRRAIAKGGAFHGMQFRPAVANRAQQLRAGKAGQPGTKANGHHLNEPHLQRLSWARAAIASSSPSFTPGCGTQFSLTGSCWQGPPGCRFARRQARLCR